MFAKTHPFRTNILLSIFKQKSTSKMFGRKVKNHFKKYPAQNVSKKGIQTNFVRNIKNH